MTYFLIFLAICFTWILGMFIVLAVMLHRDPTFSSPEAIANIINPEFTKADFHDYLEVNGRWLGILFLPSLLLVYFYALYLIKRNMRLYPELYL